MRTLTKLVFLTTLLIASTSFATEYANYPGNMCVRWSGGSIVYNYAGIGNSNTSSVMKVDCPIVKDNHTGNINSGGWLMVEDQSNDDEISCTITLMSWMDGVSGYYGGDSDCDGSGDSNYGSARVRLDCPSRTMSSSYDDYAFAYYACSIPKRDIGTSYVRSYQGREE